MLRECSYNEITGERPTLNDCDKCKERFPFPYSGCCLDHCEYCREEECEVRDGLEGGE
jgi:hypothetical protein